MTSNEVSMKVCMLPVALANAALLIASPGLGCLTTYTRALSDLCRTYDIPSTDLTHVLQYDIQNIASSLTTSLISGEGPVETRESRDNLETVCRIKEEYAEPISDPIKQEIELYTKMYWACQKLPQTNQHDHNRFENLPANLSCLEYISSEQNDSVRRAIQSASQNVTRRSGDQQANQIDTQQPKVKPRNHNDAEMSMVQPRNQNVKKRCRVQPKYQNNTEGSGLQPANQNDAEMPEDHPANYNNVIRTEVEQVNQNYAEICQYYTQRYSLPLANPNGSEKSKNQQPNQNGAKMSEGQQADQDGVEMPEVQTPNLIDAEWSGVKTANENGAESSELQSANQNELVGLEVPPETQIDAVRCVTKPAKQNHRGHSCIQTPSFKVTKDLKSNLKVTSIEKPRVSLTPRYEMALSQPNNKLITQVSYLSPGGSRRQVYGAWVYSEIMTVKYIQDNKEPKNAVMSVLRVEEGSASLPYLVISIKEGPSLKLRFKDICLVSLWKHDCIIIQHYTKDEQTRTLHIQSQASKTSSGKMRNASENNVALFNWLHTFLG